MARTVTRVFVFLAMLVCVFGAVSAWGDHVFGRRTDMMRIVAYTASAVALLFLYMFFPSGRGRGSNREKI